VEIYSLNEPGRFPEVEPSFETSLKKASSYTLVAEKEGRIVACGRLSYFLPQGFVRRNWAILSFGLVHPEHQGRGLGTALVLARLALLKTSDFLLPGGHWGAGYVH
jgi:predicted N-acetyltransferase YhbS